MDTVSLLNLCLKITGTFEGGVPSYTTLTGSFDGEGLSAGCLQWNAGQGTLQRLVTLAAQGMGWAKAQSYFKSNIQQFASLAPAEAIAFAKLHYLDDNNLSVVSPAAATAWKSFLSNPDTIAAQNSMAESEVLIPAQQIAAKYAPYFATRTRSIAFFFDVVTQEGGMSTVPVNTSGTGDAAIAYAQTQVPECAQLWQSKMSDPLTSLLLYYGYERARLGRAEYVWNCTGRRGVIAARCGFFENTHFDYTTTLD
jgi:hypothetical protein